MTTFSQLCEKYSNVDCRDLGSRQLEALRDGLKAIQPNEIGSAEDGKAYIELLRKFRQAVAENDKLHGDNYPSLLNSLLSVGEDGLYSNSLRFIFELIQNVDDCEFLNPADCCLDMHFNFDNDTIVLTYNEVGFSPFNVFAITGIAEAAKNITDSKAQIGEKGIGFKSVFGVANRVHIRSGWFSFELYKKNFTIPVPKYQGSTYCQGTEMTLFVAGKAKQIYRQIKEQYCSKDALFSRNPLLFLNKLTSLRMYFDCWRSMQFSVSSKPQIQGTEISREDNICLSIDLHDYENGKEVSVTESINCTRYVYPVTYSKIACQSRYGESTAVGSVCGRPMLLQIVLPMPEFIDEVGNGALYSFLPTQLKLSVPFVCHVPFKLDASREFVDPQGSNLWFSESCDYLATLVDYTYQDWCKVVGTSIIRYIPCKHENLFAPNNGKEQCLSKQAFFSGAHYLQFPLFLSVDGVFRKSSEIFCFSADEELIEPERIACLMGFSRHLFVFPDNKGAANYGICIEKNISSRLFQRAIADSSVTEEAILLLDKTKYTYTEDNIPSIEFKLTISQIEVFLNHEKLSRIFEGMAVRCIKNKKRPAFSIVNGNEVRLSDALNMDIDISETPNDVELFLKLCGEHCLCADIGPLKYLPYRSGIVLSKQDPLSSFSSFCYAVDQKDTFAIRMRLREASSRLNRYVDNDIGTPTDFIRELRNIRLLVRDSLGEVGYHEYINLIQKSGTDRRRFIQEILQNADDCVYSPMCTPSFKMFRKNGIVTAEYNEEGFTRSNIRSITAIGESTKNRILNSDYWTIGQKGVGFKTLFAVASEVRIESGEYSFALTDKEPTIPKWYRTLPSKVDGTHVDICLKDQSAFQDMNEKSVLALVLCLRRLKHIEIGNHVVNISDTEDMRIVAINRKQYVFRRFVYDFSITDPAALQEKTNGYREVSSKQQIVCYVPEKNALSEYALYTGLPTKHILKVPIAIDAPFELTTSREEIETDCRNWNDRVKSELYKAIVSIMNSLKESEREDIFRFTRFLHQVSGAQHVYENGISNSEYINSYPFLQMLRESAILPTYDKSYFATPTMGNAYRYPEVARILFKRFKGSDFQSINLSSIIDVSNKDYEPALNALGCVNCPFRIVFNTIKDSIESHIGDDLFRTKLYEYLEAERDGEYCYQLRNLNIIPVYGTKAGSIVYRNWLPETIFVMPKANQSTSSYSILAESMLAKASCEKIFLINISEMNDAWARGRYNDKLRILIREGDNETVYQKVLQEYKNGGIDKNESLGILLEFGNNLPLKNQLGEVVCSELFICNQPVGYFAVDMLRRITVHPECIELAREIRKRELSSIHYNDLDYDDQLTADDLEALMDSYFLYSDEILRSLYRNGQISDELISEYNLDYLTFGNANDYQFPAYSFPECAVNDISKLKSHILKLWRNPIRIVPVEVTRTIQKGQRSNGETFELGINDAREGALATYAPEGVHGMCYCQICQKVKPYRLMEVNNIEIKPKYYFPQLRVALCLECSKKFEFLRGNKAIRDHYMEQISSMQIEAYQGTVEIQIDHETTMTFTAKHFVEIQEILKLTSSKEPVSKNEQSNPEEIDKCCLCEKPFYKKGYNDIREIICDQCYEEGAFTCASCHQVYSWKESVIMDDLEHEIWCKKCAVSHVFDPNARR